MLDTQEDKPTSTTQAFKIDFSHTERIIYWTAILTPLWWLLGIQPLFYPLLIIYLLVINFNIDNLVQRSPPVFVWSWFVMALVMLVTAVLGISEMGFTAKVFAAAIMTFLKSYFLIFACLTIPFWSKVRVSAITRAVAWMSVGFLINTGIQMIMLAIRIPYMRFLPPLSRLIPGGESSMLVQTALLSPFFGIPLPRTVLHTADPPITGLVGVLCYLICLGETDCRLRKWALAGSLCALIVSFSRLSWICLPLALIIVTSFRKPLTRQLFMWLAALTSLLCSLLELTVKQLLEKPLEVFNSARSNSSRERGVVVSKTLEAWQQKPWLGWGVIRGKAWLYEDEYVSLGSFSTYAAVLYLNGIVGFIVFIVAMALTLISFFVLSIRGNLLCQRAFASLLALYMSLNATPLSWMAIYFWYYFIWLGAIKHETQQSLNSSSEWEQLSQHKWS